jgi:general secretion pathway protein I
MQPEHRALISGFTLIEVLIALAIVGISLVSIGSVMGTSMHGARALDRHVALVDAARAIEAGLPDRAQLGPGDLSGDFSGNHWRVNVSPFLDPAVDLHPSSRWVPQSVAILVTSPSGATLRIDTVRLRRRDPR